MLWWSLMRRSGRYQIVLILLLGVAVIVLVREFSTLLLETRDETRVYRNLKASYDQYSDQDRVPYVSYNKQVPLIWIGGVPRSGTTLARAMLDAHPDIRCGEETRVIPRILGNHVHMTKSVTEMRRLREARITEEVLDGALGAYILSIISNHGELAPRLCNKDPFTLRYIPRITKIFPNSKFILLLRDGRAVVHSIIQRKVTIKGFDTKTWRGALRDWNKAIEAMQALCAGAGRGRCLQVHYEHLVLHPKTEMKKILSFLEVPWDDIVLHHEKAVGVKGGIHLSKTELSTDQVNKPVNTQALRRWVGHVPADVRAEMAHIAPMLARLGYDPRANPPDYGRPDDEVRRRDAALQLDEAVRRRAGNT